MRNILLKEQAKDDVLGVEFVGSAKAKPAPKVIDSILNAELVVVCPSNPIVSIGTILSVDGIRDALRKTNAKDRRSQPHCRGCAN